MNTNGIQHIGIPTKSYTKSIDFYKKIGFNLINEEINGDSRVAFLKIGKEIIEIWEANTTEVTGAIHHIALNTNNIEEDFHDISNIESIELIDNEIKKLHFWKNGIHYFNFYGPNREIIEICQIL